MGIIPVKTKFRKQQRRRVRGTAERGNFLQFGDYGIQTMECAWLKTNQLESARKALTHHMKRGGRVWIRVCADKTYTARPAETRMGSGKGSPEYWVAVVKPGRIMFEVAGVPEDVAKNALKMAAYKLPVKTKFIKRTE